jgi:ribosomal protein S21
MDVKEKNMTIEVKKEERENSQALIRRFTKKVKRSGILIRARKSRFYQPVSKSKEMKKKAALRREKLSKEYQKQAKLGLNKK